MNISSILKAKEDLLARTGITKHLFSDEIIKDSHKRQSNTFNWILLIQQLLKLQSSLRECVAFKVFMVNNYLDMFTYKYQEKLGEKNIDIPVLL